MDDLNTQLLQEIRKRQKTTEFNEGILTADRYVQTLPQCVGSDLCYRYASKGNVSFDDILKKSAKTLTYNNSEMEVQDLYGKSYEWRDDDGDELELPKNTLMVFKHILTSPKKDRDGDVMRTEGARPDPKMLLLWQHVHTLPIGKMLRIHSHTSKRLEVVSAIIDMNDLCHDSAVMVDNGMGRFSHGFRALDFVKVKAEPGNTTGGGFDIKSFEIMEESLVSVPANTDADTQEILLSLVEGGKLTSPMMKGIGSNIRSKRAQRSSPGIDIKSLELPLKLNLEVSVNGQPASAKAVETKSCTGSEDCGCGCSGSSNKADERGDSKGATEKQEMTCPKCGDELKNGLCEKCGYGLKEEEKSTEIHDDVEIEKNVDDTDVKYGRTISSSNKGKLQHVHDCVNEVFEKEQLMSRGGKALCKDAIGTLKEFLGSVEEEPKSEQHLSLKDATVMVLTQLDSEGRRSLVRKLVAIEASEVKSAHMRNLMRGYKES